MKTISVDAMGGDNAPGEIVAGCVEALKQLSDTQIILVGDETAIQSELSKHSYDTSKITIKHTTEVIETGDSPVNSIREKKDSSLVVGLGLVKSGEAQAFISAGSTGAILVGGQVIVGKLKGVKRAPLAPLLPTTKGQTLLIDCGANVDARPEHLKSFAIMGSLYMQNVQGISNPTVALLNIGAEEEKGNALTKETYPLLKECDQINFVGNIEARDLPSTDIDVVVCEAFSANIALKLYEGMAKSLLGIMKKGLTATTRSKIGAALAMPSLKKELKKLDGSSEGGAPLLGLNGLVVKTHGSAKAAEIRNAVMQCNTFIDQDINGKISSSLESSK